MNYSRRRINKFLFAILSALPAVSATSFSARASAEKKIPLILDTDIGDDLDDTWALMMLLRMPGVDIRLISTDFGNTRYRTRLLAKLLMETGKAHIPIGMGLEPGDKPGNQSDWLGDFQLNKYPGRVHEDGVDAIIQTIKSSDEPVTLLCIGPVTNIAEALRRDPSIAENARFVGMQGSVYSGYDGKPEPDIEWNVKVDPGALQQVFAAPWECTITPLDTCGIVKLDGAVYQKVFRSEDKWMKILMQNYRIWLPKVTWLDPKPDLNIESSTLFDTVAVHLVGSEEFLKMEDLYLRVTDEGRTVIDREKGRLVRCATGWKSLTKFEEELVNLVTGDLT